VVDRTPRRLRPEKQKILAALARQTMTQFTLRLRDRELRAMLAERERSLEQERTARAEATQAVVARERTLDLVAHDLSNPVGAISLAAEMSLEYLGPDSTSGAAMQMILDATRRVEQLIKNLVDHRTIEHGLLTLDRAVCAVDALLRTLEEVVASGASRSALRLRFEVEAGLPPVLVDHDAVRQALTNVLDNAVKFSPPGGEIHVRAERAAGAVRLSVRDTGPGIRPEDRERIFLPFWRRYSEPRQRGPGLGLPIAQALVEAHGGTLHVEGEPGAGATFHIVLPAAPTAQR
jgi:signal transduction histidine kinase